MASVKPLRCCETWNRGCEDVYAAVCGSSGKEDAAGMQRYVRGVSDVTWLHRQQEVHTARGESAVVQHSALPCPMPTLLRWDYQNSPFVATLNQPNRRVRTRTHGGVGGAEPRGSPLSRCVPGMFDNLGVKVPCTTWWR